MTRCGRIANGERYPGTRHAVTGSGPVPGASGPVVAVGVGQKVECKITVPLGTGPGLRLHFKRNQIKLVLVA